MMNEEGPRQRKKKNKIEKLGEEDDSDLEFSD